MKTSYIVLFIAALTVQQRRVDARVASDVSAVSRSARDVTSCPHTATLNTTFILLIKQIECIKPTEAFRRSLAGAKDTDAYRVIFRSACTQEASVRACIADVGVEAASCLDEMESKMFATASALVEASIEATCRNGGEAAAKIFGEEFKLMKASVQLRVLSCFAAAAQQRSFDQETDIPAYTMRRYRALVDGRRCIVDVAQDAEIDVGELDRFTGALIKGCMCIAADTHEIVPCRTLDESANTVPDL